MLWSSCWKIWKIIYHYKCDNVQTCQQYRIISPHTKECQFLCFVPGYYRSENVSLKYDSKQCGFQSSVINIPGIWTTVAFSLNIRHHFTSLKCIWSFRVSFLWLPSSSLSPLLYVSSNDCNENNCSHYYRV